jgi:hypothetical protein
MTDREPTVLQDLLAAPAASERGTDQGPIPKGEQVRHPSGGFVRQMLNLGVDVVGPIGVYYSLRGAGLSSLGALAIGAVLPALSVLFKVVRHRTVDGLGLLVIATVLFSLGISLIFKSPRVLLSKDGWITGLWGMWFLFSVRANRPAAYLLARPLMEGRKLLGSRDWDDLWHGLPQFRRIWKVSSVIWGAGLIADAAVRVTMSFTLPINVVPGLGGILWPVTFVLVQVITNVYYHRAGLYQMLGARWIRT